MKILEIDLIKKTEILRNASEEELTAAEIFDIAHEQKLQETANKASAKEALLAKLGITDDEAKLLLS